MTVLFWISAAIVVYVYAGYPCLLAAWAAAADRRRHDLRFPLGQWPSLSIVVAVRNEARRLRGRIANLLEQDYPGRREIIVVSDGSTDAPGAALAPFGDAVRLIEVPAGGKPLALNAGVTAARGDILVFADARQRFAPGALIKLARNFANPRVGGATGQLVLDWERGAGPDSEVGEGVGVYWKYEKWLRRNESRVWSTLGATGAIYALRRSLWQPLPAAALLDDVLAPMRGVLGGKRIVFEEHAIAYDGTSRDAAAEARRKRRTLAGNYQILAQEPRLLLPVVNPVWLQYVSHKVGRLFVPWALIVLFFSSLALAHEGWFYKAIVTMQCEFYGVALAGTLSRAHARVPRLARTFVLLNYSAVAGLAALRRGREVWR